MYLIIYPIRTKETRSLIPALDSLIQFQYVTNIRSDGEASFG
ncbi:MAG: hypothetical protein EZS28_011774, partial [Streblomastix strix]